MDSRLLLLVLFFLLLFCSCANAQSDTKTQSNMIEPPQILAFEKYIGTKEIGNNAGFSNKEFEKGLKSVGWRKGQPYCAYAVSFILNIVKATYPQIRSGLARAFITKKSILAKDVAKGYKQVPAGWLVIWRNGNTYKGHIGIVKSWKGNEGTTIEANTSELAGSQRDGDGVWKKQRKIVDHSQFRIDYFTRVEISGVDSLSFRMK